MNAGLSVDDRTQRWLSLVTAVEHLAASSTLEEVIQVVRQNARTISGADGVTFVLRDEDQCHYVEEDAIGALWKGRHFPLSACISGWCMLRGEKAVIPDIYVDDRIPHDAYRPTFVKSLVMVPVGGGEPIAAIGSYWRERREFTEDEIALIEGLGRSTAAAIAAMQAQGKLRQNEERLQLALAGGGLGVWEIDLSTGSLTASDLCRRAFGWAAEAPLTYDDLLQAIHPAQAARQRRALERARTSGAELALELRVVRPHGEERAVEIRGRVLDDAGGAPRRMAGVVLDVTDRRRAEARHERLQAELARVGRLSELGQMGAAFAHELNQPLTAGRSYLGAVRRHLENAPSDAAKSAEIIDKADAQFVRASEVVRRIRGFVGQGEAVRAAEDVSALVEEACEIALIGARRPEVDLRRDIPADLPPVLVDRVQVQQVLLNLVRNAFEAVGAGGGRTVAVCAAPAQDGAMVELRVEDDGPGLVPEVAARLFQPFVTTKADGMGVGLSICRDIVEGHGGRMWADRAAAGGAAFRFTLPAA